MVENGGMVEKEKGILAWSVLVLRGVQWYHKMARHNNNDNQMARHNNNYNNNNHDDMDRHNNNNNHYMDRKNNPLEYQKTKMDNQKIKMVRTRRNGARP